jgi:hypothetical protein
MSPSTTLIHGLYGRAEKYDAALTVSSGEACCWRQHQSWRDHGGLSTASQSLLEGFHLLDDVRRWQPCQSVVFRSSLSIRVMTEGARVHIGLATMLDNFRHRRMLIGVPVNGAKSVGQSPNRKSNAASGNMEQPVVG